MNKWVFISAFFIITALTAGCIAEPADPAQMNESAMELQVIAADLQNGIDELSLALENQSMAVENVSDARIEFDERTGGYKMNESSIILPRFADASGQFEASARHSEKAQERFASAQEKISNRSVLRIVWDYASMAHFTKGVADAGVNFTAEIQKQKPDPWWSVVYHGGMYTYLDHQDAAFRRTGIDQAELYAYSL